MSTKQHLLQQHGLPSLFVTTMVLVGSFVNKNVDITDVVQPDSTWCDTFEMLQDTRIGQMPQGFEELTIATSVLLPIVPILLNYRGQDDFKIEILKSHILGQSSSFGISEIARHFATFPESNFFKKCNLTFFDCKEKIRHSNLSLLSDDENLSFCNTNATNKLDLMYSLHHFPASSGTLVGAAIASFIATLVYWHHMHKNNKSLYHNAPYKKYCLFTCIAIIVLVFLMYCIYLYKTCNTVEFYAVFSGAFLQVLIIVALLRQNDANK